jgi:hypothetical protein
MMTDGYEIMAGIWYKAIQEVYANCWLTPPAAVAGLNDSDTSGPDTTCEANAANFPVPVQIQKGSGVNDSNYQYVTDQVTCSILPTCFIICRDLST